MTLDVIGPLLTSIVSQGNSCSKHIYMYPPAPLVSRQHPRYKRLGLRAIRWLAEVVSKNPTIWMTELCRLGSSVGRRLVRITRDPWFESRLRSTLFCHKHCVIFSYLNTDRVDFYYMICGTLPCSEPFFQLKFKGLRYEVRSWLLVSSYLINTSWHHITCSTFTLSQYNLFVYTV